MTKGKNDEARQAEFLRGKLKESSEALEKLQKDLQSKDAAFKEGKGNSRFFSVPSQTPCQVDFLFESFRFWFSACAFV